MIFLAHIWRWWSESWQAPRRARWLYGAMTLAFGGLALAAALAGEPAVAAVAGVAAAVTAAFAALAPRLARLTSPPPDVR